MLLIVSWTVCGAGGGRLSKIANLFLFVIRLIAMELFAWLIRERGSAENAAKRAEGYRTSRRTELPFAQEPTSDVKDAAPAPSSPLSAGPADSEAKERKAAAGGSQDAQDVEPDLLQPADEIAVEVEVLPEIPPQQGYADSRRPPLAAQHLPNCAEVTVGTWQGSNWTVSFYWHWRQIAFTQKTQRLVLPFDSIHSLELKKLSANSVSPRCCVWLQSQLCWCVLQHCVTFDLLRPLQRMTQDKESNTRGNWVPVQHDFTKQAASVSRVEVRVPHAGQFELLLQREAEILKPHHTDRKEGSTTFNESSYLQNYNATHRATAAPLVVDLVATLRAIQAAKNKSLVRRCYNCHKQFRRPEEHPLCRMTDERLAAAKALARAFKPKQRSAGEAKAGEESESTETESDSEEEEDSCRWTGVDQEWQPRARREAREVEPVEPASGAGPAARGPARERRPVWRHLFVDPSLFELSGDSAEDDGSASDDGV